jgi:D-alanine-D-alanine ligase
VCARLLADFDQPVLVEEFLPGREFTVGVVGNGRKSRVVGTLEVVLKDAVNDGIYSYESKERCEVLVEYRDAAAEPLTGEVERLALDCYRALECRDVSRVDVRLDRGGRPAFLEVNPLPGLHPTHSDLPMAAARRGMTYEMLIAAIVESALERLGVAHE